MPASVPDYQRGRQTRRASTAARSRDCVETLDRGLVTAAAGVLRELARLLAAGGLARKR